MNYSPPIQVEKFTMCQYEKDLVNLKQNKTFYFLISFFWENDHKQLPSSFYIGEINMTTK